MQYQERLDLYCVNSNVIRFRRFIHLFEEFAHLQLYATVPRNDLLHRPVLLSRQLRLFLRSKKVQRQEILEGLP